ncbi:hypothetical protein [Rugosimonospora acidiphila]|uniref:hypothetical protein n=1 Tax=Rugosimonospora acidiphila TaxID=556531 RepID=UPI0031E9D6A2
MSSSTMNASTVERIAATPTGSSRRRATKPTAVAATGIDAAIANPSASLPTLGRTSAYTTNGTTTLTTTVSTARSSSPCARRRPAGAGHRRGGASRA